MKLNTRSTRLGLLAATAAAGLALPQVTITPAGASLNRNYPKPYNSAATNGSTTSSSTTADPGTAVQPNLRIGPEDLVSLMVTDSPELSRNFRVSSNGTLALPLIHQRIQAAGLLPTELETAIADQLKKEEVLVEPVVSVAVAEYRSRPVSIAGAVRHPVQFQAVGDVTLLDAITRADGLAPEAGPEILVTRKRRDPQTGKLTAEVQRIPVKGLIEQADPALNITLEGNEEIRVPEGGKFYVAGNVMKPGMVAMGNTSESTVLKALAVAEGAKPFTQKTAYIYRRVPGTADRSEIPVALEDILKRRAPDVLLQPDDILYIMDNSGKRMTATVLDRIAGFGQTTASGVLVYRRN